MVTRKQLETIAKEQSDYPLIVPGLLTNGIAEIVKLSLDDVVAHEKRNEHVLLAVDRQKKLACAYREYMTTNRIAFYTEVVKEAKEVIFPSFRVFVRMTVFSSLYDYAKRLTKMNLGISDTF
jgi:hypothetical protein